MSVKEEFLRYTEGIPLVDGFLFERFMFTNYQEEGFLKYAVFYSKDNKISFIQVAEIGKNPDFTGLKSELIQGRQVHFGYMPPYKGVIELAKGKTASWQQDGGVITLIQLEEDGALMDILLKVLKSESLRERAELNEELSALFGKSDFLPSFVGWQLVTLVFWKTNVFDAETPHWINHVQGNYVREGDFLNVELRFGCSHPASLTGLKLERKLDSGKLGAFDIQSGEIKGDSFLYYENQGFRFSVITHDNSQNKAKHAKELEELLLSAIYLLEGL